MSHSDTNHEIRRLLYGLPTDDDLDAFCLDHFPEVYRLLSGRMGRTAKCNELISRVDAADLLVRLQAQYGGPSRRGDGRGTASHRKPCLSLADCPSEPPLASDTGARVPRSALAQEIRQKLLSGGRVATLLQTHRGGGRTLARQLGSMFSDTPIAWLRGEYATDKSPAEEFYRRLTSHSAVCSQSELGDWLSAKAYDQRLLMILLGTHGAEAHLEETAATIRALLSAKRDAAFLIVGGERLLKLRGHEQYSWYRLLPANSFIDIPDLTVGEIAWLLRHRGAPEERAAMLWACTGGHPWLTHELIKQDIADEQQAHEAVRYELRMTPKLARHLADPEASEVMQRLLRGQDVARLGNPWVRHEPVVYAESRLYFDGFLRWDSDGTTRIRCPAVQHLFEEVQAYLRAKGRREKRED